MKISNYISFLFLSLILAFSACTDDDKVFFYADQAEPGTLNELSSSSYVLDPLKANDAFEKFVWGKTTYNFDAEVTYTIQADIEGKNFSSPEGVTSTPDLTAEVKTADMNRAANKLIEKYALNEGSQQKIEFRVKASAGNDKTAQYTNIVSAFITPYTNVEYPKVWVIGDYCGWNHGNSQFLFDFTGEDIYQGWIFFDGKAANGFKVTGAANWDEGNWGLQDGQAVDEEAASITLWDDGGSKDIKVYSKNYYKFSYNKETLELKKLASMDYFGIIGDGANGWGDNDDIPFEFDAEKQVFTATVTLKDGGIKFRADHKWDFNLGQLKDGETGVLAEGGDNIAVTAGEYKITVDINNPNGMTYKLETPEKLDPSKIIAQVVTSPANMDMLITESNLISWSALDFGGQTAVGVNYTVEMDLKGANFANAQTLATTKELSASITGQQFLDALEALGKAIDTPTDVDLRVKAVVTGLNDPFMSNTVSFNLTVKDEPVVEVKAPLFIVGSIFGSAYEWKNEAGAVGLGLQPFFSDNNTIGDGAYTYTGYFHAGEFKFVRTPGNWDTALGRDNSIEGKLVSNGGDNIKLETAGWYKLEVDITALTYTLTAIIAPNEESSYTKIGVIGSATTGGWDNQVDFAQTPFNKHLWILNTRLKGGDQEAKIRANNAWDISWGQSDGFPYGKGQNANDPNIKIKNTGNYCIMFNDLTNEFSFIRLD